jgi:hypothetical protein
MSTEPSDPLPGRIILGAAVAVLLIVAVAFRVADLDHLPGVNGDEAYYGSIVMAQRAGLRPKLVSGSGLPLNPFYTGVLYLIHAIHPAPSFQLLRLPALLAGLALLALAYPLLVRVFDKPTALAATLLLACLPAAIAYSRFGWDQSQAPLAALLCLYFALRRQVLGAVVMFLIALAIHPINVFLLPILLGPIAVEISAKVVAADPPTRHRLLFWVIGGSLAVLALAVVALLLLVPGDIVRRWGENLLPEAGSRLLDLRGWARFAARYGDLLTGGTIYRYIAGPLPTGLTWLERGLFGPMLLALLVVGVRRFHRERNTTALGLVGGLALSLLAFYVLVGPRLIGPGLERYAMFLLTPSAVVLAVLWRSLSDVPRWPHWSGLLAVCGGLLVGFSFHYFGPLLETGGEAHRTFRTAAVEPKQAAFAAIVARTGGQPATVLAEDWWTFFPLYYLAGNRPELRVVWCEKATDDLAPGRRFLVGFAGGPCDLWLAQNAPGRASQTIRDYAGRPVLHVWDLGTATDLLAGLAAAAAAAPPEDVPD